MVEYSEHFYKSVTSRALTASEVIANTLLQNCNPNSIIDIGAGDGSWIVTLASKSEAKRLIAVDLPGSNFESIKNSNKTIEVQTIDFEQEMIQNGEPYDLAICVEVIEHISSDRALRLLDWMSENCRAIIFSGATPGQGGTHHINEQSQSYWIGSMSKRGFIPIDNMRPQLINNKKVASYYRNNIFLYINSRYINEAYIVELLKESITQDSFIFKDIRNSLEKITHKIVSLLPVKVVTYIAEIKSRLEIVQKP